MNLDSLTEQSGEWLRAAGPEADIVISCRIRLARNLSSFPFTNGASTHQKAESEQYLKGKLEKIDFEPRLEYVNLATLSPLDRHLLVERQLISRDLSNSEGPRGVAFA